MVLGFMNFFSSHFLALKVVLSVIWETLRDWICLCFHFFDEGIIRDVAFWEKMLSSLSNLGFCVSFLFKVEELDIGVLWGGVKEGILFFHLLFNEKKLIE